MVSSKKFVLLITIDSLRRDHVGCYGNKTVSTNFIDRIASAGIRYENAFSQGAGTPESFPSIMCSLPPPLQLIERSISGVRSIAKLLKECGFSTAAFHSNPFLSSNFGYGEGFDHFYEGKLGFVDIPLISNIINVTRTLLLNKGPITNGISIVRMALEWLKGVRGSIFLWTHFMDTHFPYLPPLRKVGLIGSMTNRALWTLLMVRRIQNNLTLVDEPTRRRIINSYDSCISYVDECIEILVSHVLKQFSEGLIILTSDHGEGFWEHGYFGHSGLYEEILRVPLIIYTKGGRRKKGVVSRISLLAEIMPTIAQFVGIGNESNMSLFREEGQVACINRFICASIDPPLGTRSVGLRTETMKYIRKEKLTDGKVISEELYDISKDPLEKVNLSSTHPSELLKMREELLEELKQLSSRRTLPFDRYEEKNLMQRLRLLGYE